MEISQPSSKLMSSSLWRMQDSRFDVCVRERVGVCTHRCRGLWCVWVCECMCVCEREWVCVCVCEWVCAHTDAEACDACVNVRTHTWLASVCVCVCVCLNVTLYVCVWEREYMYVRYHITKHTHSRARARTHTTGLSKSDDRRGGECAWWRYVWQNREGLRTHAGTRICPRTHTYTHIQWLWIWSSNMKSSSTSCSGVLYSSSRIFNRSWWLGGLLPPCAFDFQ